MMILVSKTQFFFLVVAAFVAAALFLFLCLKLGKFLENRLNRSLVKKEEKRFLYRYIESLPTIRTALEALLASNRGKKLHFNEKERYEDYVWSFFNDLTRDYPELNWQKITDFEDIVSLYVDYLDWSGMNSQKIEDCKEIVVLMNLVIFRLHSPGDYSRSQA